MNTPELDVDILGATRQINQGALGAIYELPTYRPAGQPEMVFKRNFQPMTQVEQDNLSRLVDFRAGLTSAERDVLDELFTWPRCLVTERSVVVGYLMPRLGSEWQQKVSRNGRSTTELRAAQWVVAKISAADAANVDVPRDGDPLRLVLCAKLACALALLHRHGICYGDLHWDNVIFALGTPTRIRIVDCDSAKADPTSSFRQPDQQFWSPPEGQARQSPASDCYKLALFVLRCLDTTGRAQSRSAKRAARYLDTTGMQLLRDSLQVDPSLRPSTSTWYRYLRGYLNAVTRPPVIDRLALREQVVLSGGRIRLDWATSGADSLMLETTDGHRQTIPATSGSGSVEFAVTRSGSIRAVATNRYGSTELMSDPMMVFEAPSLRFVTIPAPELPSFDFATGREMAGVVRRSLQEMSGGPTVALPELPDVSGALEGNGAYLSLTAADAQVAPLLTELSDYLSNLNSEATSVVRQLTDARRPRFSFR